MTMVTMVVKPEEYVVVFQVNHVHVPDAIIQEMLLVNMEQPEEL